MCVIGIFGNAPSTSYHQGALRLKIGQGGPAMLLAVLMNELREKEWTAEDFRKTDSALKEISPAYSIALGERDSTIFRRESPELFD